jgi:Tfp pilus assembly protein PilE
MKANQKGFSVVEILVIVVIVGLIGTVGWLVYDRQKTNDKKDDSSTKQATSEQKPVVEQKLVDKTPQIVAEINALINKGEYLKLDSYIADRVSLVKQSTDGNGDLSKVDGAKSIDNYLSKSSASMGADLPWDFTGHPDFRSKVSNSSGAIKYYAAQGHFAISANNWVIAYNLNSDLKISSFYMSVSADMIE